VAVVQVFERARVATPELEDALIVAILFAHGSSPTSLPLSFMLSTAPIGNRTNTRAWTTRSEAARDPAFSWEAVPYLRIPGATRPATSAVHPRVLGARRGSAPSLGN